MSTEYVELEKALAAGKDDIVLANEPGGPIPVLQYPLPLPENPVASQQLVKEQLKALKTDVPKIETLDPEDQLLFAELMVKAKSAPSDGIIKKPLKPKVDSKFVQNLKKEFIHAVKLHVNQKRGSLAAKLDTAGEPGRISKFEELRNEILLYESALSQWHGLHHEVKHVRFKGVPSDDEGEASGASGSQGKPSTTPRGPKPKAPFTGKYLKNVLTDDQVAAKGSGAVPKAPKTIKVTEPKLNVEVVQQEDSGTSSPEGKADIVEPKALMEEVPEETVIDFSPKENMDLELNIEELLSDTDDELSPKIKSPIESELNAEEALNETDDELSPKIKPTIKSQLNIEEVHKETDVMLSPKIKPHVESELNIEEVLSGTEDELSPKIKSPIESPIESPLNVEDPKKDGTFISSPKGETAEESELNVEGDQHEAEETTSPEGKTDIVEPNSLEEVPKDSVVMSSPKGKQQMDLEGAEKEPSVELSPKIKPHIESEVTVETPRKEGTFILSPKGEPPVEAKLNVEVVKKDGTFIISPKEKKSAETELSAEGAKGETSPKGTTPPETTVIEAQKKTGAIPKVRKVKSPRVDKKPNAMEPTDQANEMPEGPNAATTSMGSIQELVEKQEEMLYATIECSQKSDLWLEDMYVQLDFGGTLSDIKPLTVVKVEVPGEKDDEEATDVVEAEELAVKQPDEPANEAYEYGTFVDVAGYIGQMSPKEVEPEPEPESPIEEVEKPKARYNPFDSPLLLPEANKPFPFKSSEEEAAKSSETSPKSKSPEPEAIVEMDSVEVPELCKEDIEETKENIQETEEDIEETKESHFEEENASPPDNCDSDGLSTEAFLLWSRPLSDRAVSSSDSDPIVPPLELSSASSYYTDKSRSPQQPVKGKKKPFQGVPKMSRLHKLYGLPAWEVQYCPRPGDSPALRSHLQNLKHPTGPNPEPRNDKRTAAYATPPKKSSSLFRNFAGNVMRVAIKPSINLLTDLCVISLANITFVLHMILRLRRQQSVSAFLWRFTKKEPVPEEMVFTQTFFQFLLMIQLFNALMGIFFSSENAVRKTVATATCNISFAMMAMNVLDYFQKMYAMNEGRFTTCLLTTVVLAVCIVEIVVCCKSAQIRRYCCSLWRTLLDK